LEEDLQSITNDVKFCQDIANMVSGENPPAEITCAKGHKLTLQEVLFGRVIGRLPLECIIDMVQCQHPN
jgi:hypothetical protein